MKHISRLLILCLLLSGCGQREALEPVFTPTETVAVQGLYDTGSDLEISSSGAIQLFPLKNRTGKAIAPFGNGILLFSEGEKTTLTMLVGDTLVPSAVKSLSFCLEKEDCHIQGTTLSYFDPNEQETVVLDENLEVVAVIPAPAELVGRPILSSDGRSLYYCTGSGIRVWDLGTNIHRILREPSSKPLYALCGNEDILWCKEGDSSYFFSVETGELLASVSVPLQISGSEKGYSAVLWQTNLWSLVFSLDGVGKQALTPRELSASYFLMDGPTFLVTASTAGKVVTLDFYDLVSGHRTASQMLPGSVPKCLFSQGKVLWGLGTLEGYEGDLIFRWDTSMHPLRDSRIYTGPYYTAAEPNLAGLQLCQQRAASIGEPYGIDILLWEAASRQFPSLPGEYRVNILNRELELLEHRLAQFPEGMLKTTAGNFPALKICLLAQREDLPTTRSSIVLVPGDGSEADLYHGLFHVMETHILSHSSAFDQWNALNPQGFRYDYDYKANAIRDSGIYLTEENRSFIDTFSMSYPKEDRARIFEYAMLPGKESYFRPKAMQKKLAAVCTGIREAYALDDSAEYPWEQYLR